MQLRTLRWLTVVVPLLFLAGVDVLRHAVFPELLHPWPGYLAVLAVVTAGVYLTSRTIFDHIETIEARLLEQNRELREVGETARRQAEQLAALHEASLVLLSIAVKQLPIDTAYAVWVGIGAAGAAIAAVFLHGETMTPARAAFLVLLLVSIIGLKLTSTAH